MYKCLVSGGCEYAYGSNLYDRSKRYAQCIANHLNLKLIDRAITNAGNELIASSTVVGINQALQTFDARDIIVIVGWTSIERYEYYNMEFGRITSSVKNEFRLVGNEANSQIRIAKFTGSNLWDPSYGYYKLLHSFNYVNSICESNKIKIINKKNIGSNSFNYGFPKVKIPGSDINNQDLINSGLIANYHIQYKQCFESEGFNEFVYRKASTVNSKSLPSENEHQLWAKHLISSHGSLKRGDTYEKEIR